jgi:hypothetical protein
LAGGAALPEHSKSIREGNKMSLWVFVLIVAAWIVLQVFILPKFGIST